MPRWFQPSEFRTTACHFPAPSCRTTVYVSSSKNDCWLLALHEEKRAAGEFALLALSPLLLCRTNQACLVWLACPSSCRRPGEMRHKQAIHSLGHAYCVLALLGGVLVFLPRSCWCWCRRSGSASTLPHRSCSCHSLSTDLRALCCLAVCMYALVIVRGRQTLLGSMYPDDDFQYLHPGIIHAYTRGLSNVQTRLSLFEIPCRGLRAKHAS